MFHKALWMQNWKLGKYVVFIFFISTLYFLPYEYHQAAQEQQQLFSHPELLEDGKFYYHYSFYSSDIFWLAIVIIALACLLIGWERSSQSGNILMAMPFKRRDIFLSKWLFGTFFIVGSFLINWVLMYFIYKSTIHFEYQSFGPFHRYFLYAIISYVAIYTASLCIGTFTGSIISQSFFSITFCVIGMGFFSLLIFFFTTHVDAIDKKNHMKYESLYTIGKKTDISVPIMHFSINYSYHPNSQPTDDNEKIPQGPAYHSYYSAKAILVPLFYTICCLFLGVFLYTRSPNENNKKIFLFQKYRSLWIWSATLYFALIGGQMLNHFDLLFSYYVGFFLVGTITYFILSRLTNYKAF